MSNVPPLVLGVGLSLFAFACGDDVGQGGGGGVGGAGGATAQFDRGSCSFTMTGAVQDSVAVEARGLTEYEGTPVLLLECATDATELSYRLRLTIPDYVGPGSYTLDNTDAFGRILYKTNDGSLDVTNYPGANDASCTVVVTSDDGGVVSGTFECTALTTPAGNRADIQAGTFDSHGVPPGMILVP